MLENVPAEMREYAQWVCYRMEGLGKKKTKIPYCPQTGRPASVKNPGQWTTYDAAISCLVTGEYHGIGFVLTHNDPFFFIDLDDIECEDARQRQIEIAKDFDTFQERSPSGMGLHIIGKGSVPSGRRVSKLGIEVYSNERYMTVTGDVFDGKTEIKLEQAKVSLLWEVLGSNRASAVQVHDGNSPQIEDDLTVYNKAANARNGKKFLDLWNGQWQGYHEYPSQSEADQGLCNILAFYTKNKNQLRRMFLQSGMFRPEKSNRPSYLEPTLKNAYDEIKTSLDFDVLFNESEEFRMKLGSETFQKETYQEPLFEKQKVKQKPKSNKGNSWEESSIPKPPGVMGEVAEYIYQQSPYPIPEVSICAAIGFMAGVCGKAYNISDSGLNHYVMLLAKTGTGKDGGRKGVNKLFNHFVDQFPIVGDFEGPSDFASGQSIVTHLSNHKTGCFLSVLGEFAVKLCELSNDKFGPNVSLKRMLLDLFTKSAKGDSFKPTVYSDISKNTNLVKSPCLSIFAEGQPELFFQNINEQTVESGLIPRFTFIHYEGKRIKRKKNFSKTEISPELESNLNSLFSTVFTYMQANSVNDVEMDSEGDRVLDQFDDYCDEMIDSHNGMIRHLWTRCSFKALKLSALVAVGLNPVKPVITQECAEWAINVILLDIAELSDQFEQGRIGGDHGELLQQTEVRKAVQTYLTLDFATVKPIGTSLLNKSMLDHGVVPMFYLSHKCIRKACFRKDRIGATNSLKRALQCLCDNGELHRLKKTESQSQFGFSGECFAILNKEILANARQKNFRHQKQG